MKGIQRLQRQARATFARGCNCIIEQGLVGKHAVQGDVLKAGDGAGEITSAEMKTSDGELHLFGEACHSMSRNEKQSMRRRYMGFIFQNFNLLPVLSAVENVELSLYGLSLSKTKMREAAIAMLAKVGLEQRAYHYPSELSGGQQQRVGIARALVHNPKLVMADEPTANLDSETASQIVQLMRKLAHEQGTTFLVSSHDARLMSKVDRTLSLTDGVLM